MVLQPLAQPFERSPARIDDLVHVLVRLEVQVPAANRAEAGAVGVVEDLIRQRQRDRVARPGRELEVIVDDVLALELVVPARCRGVIFPRVHPDVECGVLEAAHARSVQSYPEAQLEEQTRGGLGDHQLGVDLLRHGEVALTAEVERVKLDRRRVPVLLTGSKPKAA